MKPLLILFCSFFILSVFYSFNDHSIPNFFSKESTSESTFLNKVDNNIFINPLELTGEFQIWKNISGEVVFYTETKDNVFIFSCNECDIDINQLNSKEQGILTYLDHAFIFKNQTGLYYFAVDKPEEKLIKNNLDLNIDKDKEGYGIGIVKTFFKRDIKQQHPNFDLDVRNSSKLSEYFKTISDSPNNDCESGGWGSSSCSLGGSGCSVSCIAGYYACCNPGNCDCIERTGTKPFG